MHHRYRAAGRRAAITATLAVAVGLAALANPGAANAGVERFGGHLSVGYARLFVTDAPAGSFSIVGGLNYPVMDNLRIGGAVGFHLLGSRTIRQGSLVAGLDYSVFEAAALVHWSPPGVGPLHLSGGPALLVARAELNGGGAGFAPLAIEEAAPGLAFDVTWMQRRPSPVRVGLEIGTRVGFLEEDTWTLGTARVVFHY